MKNDEAFAPIGIEPLFLRQLKTLCDMEVWDQDQAVHTAFAAGLYMKHCDKVRDKLRVYALYEAICARDLQEINIIAMEYGVNEFANAA